MVKFFEIYLRLRYQRIRGINSNAIEQIRIKDEQKQDDETNEAETLFFLSGHEWLSRDFAQNIVQFYFLHIIECSYSLVKIKLIAFIVN